MDQLRGWQFWIDRGGTFTDVVARAPDGRLHVEKLLSEDPRRPVEAGAAAIHSLLERHGGPEPAVSAIRLGTTVATNALLERAGVPTALLITAGLGDALQIGYQNRPDLFSLHIVTSAPLYAEVVEVNERVAAEGEVLQAPDIATIKRQLARLRAMDIASIAIVFMHGYRHPAHERLVAGLARDAGFDEVIASHEASSLIRLVSRGDTTVVDAYLAPLLARYVRGFRAQLGRRFVQVPLQFMQSNGGLVDPAGFRAANAILSGPAGGLVGMQRAGESLGRTRLIAFDMGGTSTDVALYDGGFAQRHETSIAGVRLQAPMMSIHTVAAGGGSLLRFDGGRLQVGPRSAGADPGPACYRNGGPLTVTDLNVLLGRIRPELFPAVFGADGRQPLDTDVVRQSFDRLAAEVAAATGSRPAVEQLAEGFLAVAIESMARAIRHVSVRQGHDPAGFSLFCYGGAGGQHACRVADALGIGEVLIHPLAGVLSAWGIGLADQRLQRRHSIGRALDELGDDGIEAEFEPLSHALCEDLLRQGAAAATIRLARQVELRPAGTETAIAVDVAPAAEMVAAFGVAYLRQFGFEPDLARLEVATLFVEASVEAGEDPGASLAAAGAAMSGPAPVRAWFGDWLEAKLWRREALAAGACVIGPALIAEDNAMTVLEPGWSAECLRGGMLRLWRHEASAPAAIAPGRPDPAQLEVFNHRFMQVAEQMGAVLQSTAVSVNIRERLDFSCALFDGDGALIANAPHMPVHLGSMGASIRSVLERNRGVLRAGDSWMLNAPDAGGTHLPDMTVVTPVFHGDGPEPAWFVASRAHHADLGGVTPGSMPPHSGVIDEEGILFDNFQLVEAGRMREQALRERLGAGSWPARSPDQNVADLKAQLAANARGIAELRRLLDSFGRAAIDAYMRHVQDNAEACVRAAIGRLRTGHCRYELDDGGAIKVRVEVEPATGAACIDFEGTSPQSAGNFNAPLAVTTAAVLYVFRTLVAEDIPLNEGCLRPLTIRVPPGSLLNPSRGAAVAAGNVETSQCIVDALYGALGVLAASQGTMNNLTFGDDRDQYYETIAGGAGAGAEFGGASGVQTHMTNSRLTDPEVLESRYPVLLREFRYRRGSGGAGRHRGGDGLVRSIEFRRPLSASILSGHRRVRPFGLDGGSAGAAGRNVVVRRDGSFEVLGACATVDLAAGDRIVIETPGGGGFGRSG